MKKIKNLSTNNILRISFFIFIFLTISFSVFLYSNINKNNYLFKFKIEYERKLIDQSLYRMYVESKFPKISFKRGEDFYVKCLNLETCEKLQKSFLQDIDYLNKSLWSITKKFVDEKIIEIGEKIKVSNLEVAIGEIEESLNIDGNNTSFNSFVETYKYLLNLEYLRGQTEPMIVTASSEIINNTWNNFFTKFFTIVLLNVIISLTLFVFLYSFYKERNK